MNKYDKHEVEVNKYYLDIKFDYNKELSFNKLNELYKYVKNIQDEYINEGKIDSKFNFVADKIYKSEDVFYNDFIIESSPNYTPNEYRSGVCIEDKEDRLNWIINRVRGKLSLDYSEMGKDSEERLKKASMSDECTKSSKLVNDYCKEYGLNSRRLIIYPGFVKKPELYGIYKFHAFNIVNIYNKNYIVDLTYRQFFCKDQSSLDRIGIYKLTGTLPGSFMLMNESRKKTALQLLKNGYIEMTDENIKNYFDGFALSFRNGTFYDLTEDYSYTTPYSSNDYIKFMNGEDSQYHHEGEEVLGYQKKKLLKK